MYLCISLNPAIDKRMRLAELQRGAVNRVQSARPAAGGKAAHVALALKALGEKTSWIGFAGGASGEELCSQLAEAALTVTRVPTASETRVNLEIIEQDGCVTEVLEPGGPVTPAELNAMTALCQRSFREAEPGSIVALSGSVPPGVLPEYCAELIRMAQAANHKTFVDLSGASLASALSAKPDFVKPNRQEAQALLGNPMDGPDTWSRALLELRKRGAGSVAISLGARGLIWLPKDSDAVLFADALSVPVISTVGCGDATLAAFIYAFTHRLSLEDSLRLAVACGAANCQTELPGRIDIRLARSLMSKVQISGISNAPIAPPHTERT